MPAPKPTTELIEDLFTFHPVKEGQADKYVAIRTKAKELAYLINDTQPDSAEKTLALRALHQCTMHANSGIAINT